MAELDNPAGRLHELLRRFAAIDQNLAIKDAWAQTLGVPSDKVLLYLGKVASLLLDVERAAVDSQREAFAPMSGHLQTLAGTIFPVSHAFNVAAGNVAPDAIAMQMLHVFSEYLHTNQSEGEIPDEVELHELSQEVQELIVKITAADLPPEIRKALLHRLAEMLEALEFIEVGGPRGCQARCGVARSDCGYLR